MICILAADELEAETWAHSHLLARNEWFFPRDENELKTKSNFHVLVVGTAGFNMPVAYFNRIFALAQLRGRIGRI